MTSGKKEPDPSCPSLPSQVQGFVLLPLLPCLPFEKKLSNRPSTCLVLTWKDGSRIQPMGRGGRSTSRRYRDHGEDSDGRSNVSMEGGRFERARNGPTVRVGSRSNLLETSRNYATSSGDFEGLEVTRIRKVQRDKNTKKELPEEAMENTKICCIGAGYVGGPTMAAIAYKCPDIKVTVVDINKTRIDAWNSDKLPIFEPGLDDMVASCKNKNLFFSTDVHKHVEEADIVFVSVNTPTKVKGIGAGYAADLTYWESAARMIASCTYKNKIIVEKSTVPVKTAEAIEKVIKRNMPDSACQIDVLSNPEFLAEGTAVADLMSPDRVLIGGRQTESGLRAVQKLVDVYAHWIPRERILTSNLWSAELAKLTANAMLAQRISSVNAISALCEVTGADVEEVARCVGTDSRIGGKFLRSSVGFGGSCFQKDILNLVYICECNGLKEVAEYWRQVIVMNNYQKRRFVHRIVSSMFNTVNGKRIAVLGFAFKKDTGDTRETPAIDVCGGLLSDNATVCVYDPQVTEEQVHQELEEGQFEWDHPHRSPSKKLFSKQILCYKSAYEAAKDAHALCILTEWDEFRDLDYQKLFDNMVKPAFVFDGRNLLNHDHLRKIGFVVYSIGKPIMLD